MDIRLKLGFKDSVGVQSGQNGKGEWKKKFGRLRCRGMYWAVAVDPWQLSGPGGQGEGGGVVYHNRADVSPVDPLFLIYALCKGESTHTVEGTLNHTS